MCLKLTSATTYINDIDSGGGVALHGLLSPNSLRCCFLSPHKERTWRTRVVEGLPLNDIPHWFQSSALAFYFIFFLPCLPLCRCQSFISGSLSFTSPQDIGSLLLLSLSHCFSSFWPTPRHSDTWTPPTCPSPRACLLLQGCKRSTLYLFIYLFIYLRVIASQREKT